MFKNIKSIRLLWFFQLFLIGYFFLASYKYNIIWCEQNHYYFKQYIYLIYTTTSVFIVLFFPLLNYFYLLDKFINKHSIYLFLMIIIQLYSSMYLNATLDTYFLKEYNVPWLMSPEHINGRFFINCSFFGLFSIHKLIENYYNKNEDEKRFTIGQLESEIKLLRSQINPHFLFNSLNNIYSYSIQKKEETPELVLKLSEILRFLSDSKKKSFYIDAENEIKITQNLIDLHLVNKRWIPKIIVTINRHINSSKSFLIEPHTILTLVENSFKHCNLDEENAFIKIEINLSEDYFHCVVANTIQENPLTKTGQSGLSNLEKRLKITYGKSYNLLITSKNNTFIVNLKLPQLDNKLLHN